MAVPEQTPYSEHTGNGITTSFALGFQCETKDHLIVLVDDIEPPIATWNLTGGNVVFTTAPASDKKITIQRNTPFSRNVDYQSYNNSFRPPAVNKDFDWIWWKLQELGVADWILGNRISALKNYVDRKDDELKAYLMEEIRKQGVALDQLDEYYNYLMQRLAQIAIDKGWDASFVVDASGKTQQELNDALKKTLIDRLNVRDFGAILDGTEHKLSEKFTTLTIAQVVYPFATSLNDTLDFCAYQAAINYATTKGFNTRPTINDRTGRGGIVYTPSGQAVINRSLIMPRSGNYDGASVYIEGESTTSSAISATATFPAGRALIEWEDAAQRVYWQGIRNVTFRLPDIADTKAIWFKKSSVCIAGGSTTSLIFAEYAHGLRLEYITVEGSNSYHKNCIQFDGYVRYSKFDYLISNLGRGLNPIYNTVLLQFASDYGTSSVIKGESNGVAYSEINNIWGMGQRGGNGVLVKGRFLESTGKNWINGNGTTDATPAFEINNSYIFTLAHTGSEGRAERPQYLIKSSIGVNIQSIGLGGIDGDGGVGVKFEACESCTLNGRYATPSDPSFSSKNGKAVIIDANCINVKVTNFYISANPEQELEILAPPSAGNSISWIRASNKTQGTYLAGGATTSKDIVLATRTLAQSAAGEGAFTTITWQNVSLDTTSKFDTTTGLYSPNKPVVVRISGGVTLLNVVENITYELNTSLNGAKSDRLALFTAERSGAIFIPFNRVVVLPSSAKLGIGIVNNSGSPVNIGMYSTLGSFSIEEIV